jgi:prepilin signal peptidase PulO-like enzyme (type II secretory pathway)
LGSLLILSTWAFGGPSWLGLQTSLLGMAIGGGMLWSVRVVGYAALGREALGFGDVTLMAMIGSMLGWQACLVTFFLSPFPALAAGIAHLILRRENEIPFGPYLCAAALYVYLRWGAIWSGARPVFELGWMIGAIFIACLGLMGAMLVGMRTIRGDR